MQIADEDSFIEAASRVFGAGMPPMAGRIWAYLAICEPPQQTAAMIADRLHASRGSVSGMARLLEQVGLIRRHTRPGDRREYFDIPPDALHRLMEVAVIRLRQNREMAEAGLALIADRSPESQARLRDIDPSLSEAARDLGSNPIQAFWLITVPVIFPAILSAALLAAALSIDDFIITSFVAGQTLTFPLWVYGSVKVGIPPQVFAMGTLIFAVGVLIAIAGLVMARRSPKSA